MTDQQVIEAIKLGGEAATKALDFVFDQHGEKIMAYLMHKEIDRSIEQADELAYDFFIEAIMALCDNVLAERLVSFNKASMGTYLTTICRYKYYAWKKKVNKPEPVPLVLSDGPVDEELPIILRRFVREMKEKCREMLTYFYFDGLPMKEVIVLTTHTYTSAAIGNVANQRCRQKLKEKLADFLITHEPTQRHDEA